MMTIVNLARLTRYKHGIGEVLFLKL